MNNLADMMMKNGKTTTTSPTISLTSIRVIFPIFLFFSLYISHSFHLMIGGVVCWPVSTLKADILYNICDCCARNDIVIRTLKMLSLAVVFSLALKFKHKYTTDGSFYNCESLT